MLATPLQHVGVRIHFHRVVSIVMKHPYCDKHSNSNNIIMEGRMGNEFYKIIFHKKWGCRRTPSITSRYLLVYMNDQKLYFKPNLPPRPKSSSSSAVRKDSSPYTPMASETGTPIPALPENWVSVS